MKVVRVLTAPGTGGYFYDDQAAIRAGAQTDGDTYSGRPVTAGFRAVRVPARTLGIGLQLEDGFVAWGDAMSVQYAGAAGRDPLFEPFEQREVLERVWTPLVQDRSIDEFRPHAAACEAARIDGAPLHAGLRYGATQALLRAAAHANALPMAAIIAREYALPLVARGVPIHAQTGPERYRTLDRMIEKRVDSLPHGLFNTPALVGRDGEAFSAYVAHVLERIEKLGEPGYVPILHFDVYGCLGIVFNYDIERIATYLETLAELTQPHLLRIEAPVDFGSASAQRDGYAALRGELRRRGCRVEIVVDEWCNSLEDIRGFIAAGAADVVQIKVPDLGGIDRSIEAVAQCKAAGIAAYLGGSCTETDLSARVCAHVAVATQASVQLAKPGMGVDEGIAIVANEQSRLLCELAALQSNHPPNATSPEDAAP